MMDHVSERTSFPSGPGPDQRSRSRPARHGAADHRPSEPRVRSARARGAQRHQGRLQDVRAGRHLSGLGHRRLGGVSGQYAVAGRQGARVRERRVRQALVRRGQTARPRRRSGPPRVGQRRRSCDRRSEAVGGSRSQAAGGPRRAQRDVDGRHQPAGRDPEGDRSCPASGAAAGRCGFLARLDRPASRRMGYRCDAHGLAEGAHAAAGPELQRHQRKGACGLALRPVAEVVLGVGADDRRQSDRLLPVHARHQSAVRLERSAAHAGRRGSARMSLPGIAGWPRPRARRFAPGAWRSCAGARKSTARS